MKSERRSSAKGKLKLVIITFINRHFLVKKKVVAGGKVLFLFDARKTSFITTLFYALLPLCAAKLCSQRSFDRGGGLPYETDGDARRLA